MSNPTPNLLKRKAVDKSVTQPAKKIKRVPKPKDTPATSAVPPAKQSRQNLTLSDWMTVFAYIDSHRDMKQAAVVKYFRTRPSGHLIFDQSTLSRKLRERSELEAHVHSHPNALSGRRPRAVVRPDVERALVKWFHHMEKKGESVTGPMLKEKRQRFEEAFDVPDDERLSGESWVQRFCTAYKIREHRRHGEAGSVDLDAVEAERARCQQLLARYAPCDRYNIDETAFYPYAPPDRGLATQQMSGKKREKFRITIAVACNAEGDKLDLFFIGKAEKPRCFKKQKPEQRGFYYRNNKKAWMTSALFKEWVIKLDSKMCKANRHIILLMDNFKGHTIEYKPTNIELEYFEPNMTPFVQPCDAGIIRTFKALYRKSFNQRAIDRDEAGEREIYKIDLLEAMSMAQKAWRLVSKETIKHCWGHALIQPYVVFHFDHPDICIQVAMTVRHTLQKAYHSQQF